MIYCQELNYKIRITIAFWNCSVISYGYDARRKVWIIPFWVKRRHSRVYLVFIDLSESEVKQIFLISEII